MNMYRKLTSSHLSNFMRRCQSTHAATKYSGPAVQAPLVSGVTNGIISASAEHDAPVSRVAVVVNAGSRYERNDQQGITHYLRALSSNATTRSSAIGLVRSMQQMGANLSCTSHREYLMYSVECLPQYIDECVEWLRVVSTTPAFKPWEIADISPYLQYDLAVLDKQPNIKCMEELVKVAYKDTVGRSLYIKDADIGRFTSEDLMEYVQTHFSDGNVAIVAVGVSQDDFNKAVDTFQVHPKNEHVKQPAKYHGGESRVNTRDNIVYASICAEGVGYGNKDAYSAWVLQGIMGTGGRLKWSEGTATSRLGSALQNLASHPTNAVSCIDVNYSDCGLFGFMVSGESREIGKVLEAAYTEFSQLSKAAFTDEEVKKGKEQAKSGMYMCLEEGENKLLDMGDQILWNGQVMSSVEMSRHLDNITTDEVNEFAKQLVQGRLSMSAVGDLTHTPYLHHFTDTR